jgi:hypothetical protein
MRHIIHPREARYKDDTRTLSSDTLDLSSSLESGLSPGISMNAYQGTGICPAGQKPVGVPVAPQMQWVNGLGRVGAMKIKTKGRKAIPAALYNHQAFGSSKLCLVGGCNCPADPLAHRVFSRSFSWCESSLRRLSPLFFPRYGDYARARLRTGPEHVTTLKTRLTGNL